MTLGASELFRYLDNTEMIDRMVNEIWTNRRLSFRGYTFEFSKSEFLTALNESPMAKKKIEPGTPEGVGIAWVDDTTKTVWSFPEHPIHPYLGETGLETYGKWKDIITKRSGWKDEFEEVVALAASQYEIYIDQTQKLQIEGMTVEHRNGAIGQNPRVSIQQSAWKNVFTFSNRFGFNPLFEGKVSKHEDDDSEI